MNNMNNMVQIILLDSEFIKQCSDLKDFPEMFL